MREVKKRLIDKFNMKDIDWLGYYAEEFEYHHIKKREDGGLYTVDNGALLGNIDHKYIHIVEYKDIERYLYLNAILKIINEQGHLPTRNQLKIIDEALKVFEREHCSDINSKGKPLIREEYTRRLGCR